MPDLFTVQQLADYLQVSKRTVYRLVEQNKIPSVRIGGQWRFRKSSVDYYLDLSLPAFGPLELHVLEADVAGPPLSLHGALVEANALIALDGETTAAVVRSFVTQVQFPEPVDHSVVARRVLERETLCSTAIPGGIAVLHTARWQPRVLRGNDLLAIGRVVQPIDFGALDGGRTDLLALVLARNERNHLLLLTRMIRLCQEDGFLDRVRAAQSAGEVLGLVTRLERLVFPSEDTGGAHADHGA